MKAFSSAMYELVFLVIEIDVNPPITWLSFVQRRNKSEFLLWMSFTCPKVYWLLVFRRKRSWSFFFWKPSLVKKLASLGSNRLLQLIGSLSNYSREEYISSIYSSSNYSSSFVSVAFRGAAYFAFLKLVLMGLIASAAGLVISLSKLPGTIWLWIVLSYSS